MFSLALGTMFVGVALGPVIGGILIRATGSILSTFYLAAAVHTLHAAFTFMIIPESQTKARASGAQQRRQVSLDRRNDRTLGATSVLKSAMRFFSPLAVLLPERISVDGNPLKRSKRDWSLCYIAASYGFTMSLMVRRYHVFVISPILIPTSPAGSGDIRNTVCRRKFQVVIGNGK